MLKLIREVLRVGQATLLYPLAPIPVAPGFRGKPQHDWQRCIACGACAVACPSNALSLATHFDRGVLTWQLFVGRCIYCGRCEEVCPTHAIALSPDFELAVMNKADLYERADYPLAACTGCGTYFAPAAEVAYAAALLEQHGLAGEQLAQARTWLSLCPECKRKNDVRKWVSQYQEGD